MDDESCAANYTEIIPHENFSHCEYEDFIKQEPDDAIDTLQVKMSDCLKLNHVLYVRLHVLFAGR